MEPLLESETTRLDTLTFIHSWKSAFIPMQHTLNIPNEEKYKTVKMKITLGMIVNLWKICFISKLSL